MKKLKINKISVFIVAALMVVLTTQCEEEAINMFGDFVAVSGLTLSDATLHMEAGDTLTLVATVAPSSVSNNTVRWMSSNNSVATVIAGKITAVGAGVTTITATSLDNDTYFDTCEVTVIVPVTNVKVEFEGTAPDMPLPLDVSIQLIAIVTHIYASSTDVTWSSDNVTAVIVDQTGLITTIDEGKAKIRATSVTNPEHFDEIEITVEDLTIPVESVDITSIAYEIEVDSQKDLVVTVLPVLATNRAVEWSSSNPARIAVDPVTGSVTVISQGKATITATSVSNPEIYDEIELLAIENLLVNPGFETPDDGTATLQSWTVLPGNHAWFSEYYTDPGTAAAAHTANRVPKTDGLFTGTGNGVDIVSVITGDYIVRINGSQGSAAYQVINVTPGKTYVFGADVAFRRNNNNLSIKDYETLKVLTVGGVKIADVLIPINEISSSTTTSYSIAFNVRGQVTIPAEVTQVRFQFDQRHFANPNSAPLMFVDECVFYELVE